MAENDESEILEEIVSEGLAPRADTKKVKPKLIIKVPKKKSIADDDELSDDSRAGAEPCIEKIKPKAVRTQKQIDAFQKVRDKKMENAKLRQKEKILKDEEDRKELEAKIIKKAVAIKKKQIKKQTVLEEISDDETPIEVIKEMKKNIKEIKHEKPEKPKPKFIFV